MRRFGVRKIRILIAIVAVAVAVGIPTAVMASSGGFVTGSLDTQEAVFTTTTQTVTSSKTWVEINGLHISSPVCARAEIAATLSVQLTGAPAGFRIQNLDDVPNLFMQPGEIRFVPAGSLDSASFTFVANLAPITGSDAHNFSVQWHSATGKPVTLTKATVNLQYQNGICS
jgi:hypothetical protein